MAFKPHYGYCKFCDKEDQLIVVRAGYCQKCNHEQKQAKKKAAGKKTGKYQYKREASGEGEMFRAIALDTIGDEPTRCYVCKTPIAVVTHNNMAHVLSKKQFPDFRLNPDNVKILCHRFVADDNGYQGCHYQWDMRPRSEIANNPLWQPMLELEAQLKQEYNGIKQSTGDSE